MDSKLTLKLDSKVIQAAKVYSKNTGMSISKMVENYLKSLTSKDDEVLEKLKSFKIPKAVEDLCGIIEDPGDDWKGEYYEHLHKKHL